jgi:hypothetical protein
MTVRTRQPEIVDRRAVARTWLARALAVLLALALPGVAVGTGQDTVPRQPRVAGPAGQVASLPAAALQAKASEDIAPLPQTGWGLPAAAVASDIPPAFHGFSPRAAALARAHDSRPYDTRGPPAAA